MTKAKISQYDAVAGNNTDVNGVNIAEGCPPSSMNNMGREIMAALKRYQVGSDGDGVTVGGNFVVSGTTALSTALPVASGGTGLATLTANNVVVGNGTSTPLFVAPGTSGNVLTSNGTTWASTAASSSLTGTTDSASPFETSLGTGAGAVTTGVNNTFVGFEAGNDNTTGADNTAVGFQALDANTTAGSNTAVGAIALSANTTGEHNTAIGRSSLLVNTTGSSNTAFGSATLEANTTGTQNVAVGRAALIANTTGTNNTAVGFQAGDSVTTGAISTFVGNVAGSNATTGSNNGCFGHEAGLDAVFNLTTESNRVVIGNNNVTNAYIKVAFTVTSDARDKTSVESIPHGLSFVQQLNPVSYRWKTSREDDTPVGNKRYGFLAQDILALEGDDPIIIDNEVPDHLKYQGESLVPVLVNAIKELSAQVTALQAEVNTLKGQP